MARAEALTNAMKKIRLPQSLVPQKLRGQMDLTLANAAMPFSATEWLGLSFVLSIISFALVTLLKDIVYGIGAALGVSVLMFLIPGMQAGKRKASIEASLPDALHHMSVAIRSGLVLESVIQEIAQAEYGALSEEFSQIMVEMRRGLPLKDALMGFSKKIGSKEIQRAVRLLLEGIESGGPISDVLDEVSEDMRAVRMIQRERKSATTQQITFLVMASLIAGPFVMGVVAGLPGLMKGMGGGEGMEFPVEQVNQVVGFLTLYVIGQAIGSGIMMGVIMYGDMKRGIKYGVPMAIAAYLIYSIIRAVIPSALSAF